MALPERPRLPDRGLCSAHADGRSLEREVPWPERSSVVLGLGLFGSATSPSEALVRKEIESSDPPRPGNLVHGLPLDLDAICWKAIHKEPAQRYPSGRALADDLRHWLKSEHVMARPARTFRRLVLWAKRNKGWAVALVITAFSAFALGAGGLALGNRVAAAAKAEAKVARVDGELRES